MPGPQHRPGGFSVITRPVRAFGRFMDETVRDQFGWSLPPARLAISHLGIQPDNPLAYCCRCGGSVGPGEGDAKRGCARCRRTRPAIQRLVRVGPFSPPLHDLVRKAKYRPWPEMARELGRLLGEACLQQDIVAPNSVLVPMPMPLSRRMYRGIDHAHQLALGMRRALRRAGIRSEIAAMLRKSNGPPQVSLPMTERERSPSQRMTLARWCRDLVLDDRDLILVDDVRTTGATLNAAGRLLRSRHPRSMIAAIVAVADEKSRGDRDERPTLVIEHPAEESLLNLP